MRHHISVMHHSVHILDVVVHVAGKCRVAHARGAECVELDFDAIFAVEFDGCDCG